MEAESTLTVHCNAEFTQVVAERDGAGEALAEEAVGLVLVEDDLHPDNGVAEHASARRGAVDGVLEGDVCSLGREVDIAEEEPLGDERPALVDEGRILEERVVVRNLLVVIRSLEDGHDDVGQDGNRRRLGMMDDRFWKWKGSGGEE